MVYAMEQLYASHLSCGTNNSQRLYAFTSSCVFDEMVHTCASTSSFIRMKFYHSCMFLFNGPCESRFRVIAWSKVVPLSTTRYTNKNAWIPRPRTTPNTLFKLNEQQEPVHAVVARRTRHIALKHQRQHSIMTACLP